MAFRYRYELPGSITKTAENETEWVIAGMGTGLYQFKIVGLNRIVPRENLAAIKIPDATPEIIGAYTLGDEQALLAKLRYNRLIDIFLGITAYSLQNHLRTSVAGIGQVDHTNLTIRRLSIERTEAIQFSWVNIKSCINHPQWVKYLFLHEIR